MSCPIRELLAATALARALSVPPPTVLAWKRRDSIPEARWRSIAAAAKDLRVKGVTYSTLSAASQAKTALDA